MQNFLGALRRLSGEHNINNSCLARLPGPFRPIVQLLRSSILNMIGFPYAHKTIQITVSSFYWVIRTMTSIQNKKYV
uniref:Uncharacterized protein n=1 Tax=Romanomermis culicivorax TaxID=13658 RepID=A0A915JRY3_ROMCU